MLRNLDYYKNFLNIESLRKGYFTDKYFVHIREIFSKLRGDPKNPLNHPQSQVGISSDDYFVPDAEVEMQWFTRRPGRTVIAGIEFALACIRYCSGYWLDNRFVDTSDELKVWAVDEGSLQSYSGRPDDVTPILRIQGKYKDFGINETVTLGYLTRASRVATNVYQLLEATGGKPTMFFPARYDIPEVQMIDGLAYATAIDAYNREHQTSLTPFVSTDAQGEFIHQRGGGTIPHAAIACFLGNTNATTMAFAEFVSPDVKRVALVDYDNDCVGTSIAVAKAFFDRHRIAIKEGNEEAIKRFTLFAVRLDTSSALRDVSVPDTGNPLNDNGVNPTLVNLVRQGLDSAWEFWELDATEKELARSFCQSIQIVASGGFNVDKIQRFERVNAPVDIYAVGSSTFDNHGPTVTDFTADVVKVKVRGKWLPMAKIGRKANDNPDLKQIW